MSLDGISLGYISTNIYAQGLAVVGNEVWFGGQNSYSIGRTTFGGTTLPSLNIGNYAESIAVIPEPATLLLLAFGISMLKTRKSSK